MPDSCLIHALHRTYSVFTVRNKARPTHLGQATADTDPEGTETMTQSNLFSRGFSLGFIALVAVATLAMAFAPSGSLYAG